MGILKEPAAWVKALNLPQGFSVCELGDQWMSGLKKPMLAHNWYKNLGCGRYVSIDGNGKATLTADLNRPLEPLGPFDLVTDFGTSEHIFDQAQVWRTLHALMKVGGYLVIDRPMQGYDGHCYYRIDLCLLEDVARVNRYEIVQRIQMASTPRGELARAVFRKTSEAPFKIPQQGRYLDSLVIR